MRQAERQLKQDRSESRGNAMPKFEHDLQKAQQ
jgi:hypothetical protein